MIENPFGDWIKFHQDLYSMAETNLSLARQATSAAEQIIAAQKAAQSAAGTPMAMWKGWIDLWTPAR